MESRHLEVTMKSSVLCLRRLRTVDTLVHIPIPLRQKRSKCRGITSNSRSRNTHRQLCPARVEDVLSVDPPVNCQQQLCQSIIESVTRLE